MSIPVKRPCIFYGGTYEKVELPKRMEDHHKFVLYPKNITLSSTILYDNMFLCFPRLLLFLVSTLIPAGGNNANGEPNES